MPIWAETLRRDAILEMDRFNQTQFSPGVALKYNDETIDLQPHTRRDVANVVVGASADDTEPAPQTNATQATLLW